MIQKGFIDNSWGYGFGTWGNESNLANPKLLLQRILSLAPTRLTSNQRIGKDASALAADITCLHSFAKEIVSSLQHLVQAALVSVLLADDSRTELVPRQPDLASWLPDFALPAIPMTSLSDFCLQYPGTQEDFSHMIAQHPIFQQQLEQMDVAVGFWKQTRRCIRALSDDMDVPHSLIAALEEGDDWLHQQQERLGLKFSYIAP
jgi:hypothetical protein